MAKAKRRKGVGARLRNPTRPDLKSLRVRVPEVGKVPRAGVTAATLTGTPPPPPGWHGPATEWAVYYDLTVRRHGKEGPDFQRQVAITAPGLNLTRDFTRADFLILPTGKFGGLGAAYAARGLIINPVSYFTHPEPGKDRLERAILAGQGFLEIFIDEADLQTRPHEVVGLALQGRDVSSRRLP